MRGRILKVAHGEGNGNKKVKGKVGLTQDERQRLQALKEKVTRVEDKGQTQRRKRQHSAKVKVTNVEGKRTETDRDRRSKIIKMCIIMCTKNTEETAFINN